MMKTANGRKRLPSTHSNSGTRNALRAPGNRRSVVSSSLRFLRQRTSAIGASLRDRSDRSRAQRFAGTAFLIRAASGAMGLPFQVLLARWMGAHEFGIYAYVWTWVLLIGSFIDFGFETSAQRFIPAYSQTKKFDLLRGFIRGSGFLVLGFATVIAAFSAIAIRVLQPWIGETTVLPLYLACLVLPLYGLALAQGGIARSYDWTSLALTPSYIIRQIVILALVGVAYFAGFGADAVTATAASLIAVWATSLVQYLILRRKLRNKIARGPAAYDFKEWLRISLPIFMVGSFFFLLTYVDVLILQAFRSPQEVAVYFAATKVLALVGFIYYSVAAASAHNFTRLHVSGDRRKLAAFFTDSVRWTFWPSLAMTALVLLLGKPILYLFGAVFTQGYSLLFILSVGILARAAVGPADRLLNMLGEQKICAWVYVCVFALNLVGCLVLIPSLGITGAAISTSTALIVESITLFLIVSRRLGMHPLARGPRVRNEAAAMRR
jgi:O-antigen/teichoic acid export membrane protein